MHYRAGLTSDWSSPLEHNLQWNARRAHRSNSIEEIEHEQIAGHRKWPEHKVQEKDLGQTVKIEVNGEVIAEGSNVIRVDEDRYPARYYFPRSDFRMERLEQSSTTTKCPLTRLLRRQD